MTLKLATTIDGRIATATGESQWITGPEARVKVHALRACHDCVMVGAGTARADNPSLTVRDADTSARPVRLVISRSLSLPWPNKLIETVDKAPVWIAHAHDADSELIDRWKSAGATLLALPVIGEQLDLISLFKDLAKVGLTRVFCEGGGTLAASLLEAGLVDDLFIFTAGKVLGSEAQAGVGTLGISQLADAPQFDLVEITRLGGDIMHHWRTNSG